MIADRSRLRAADLLSTSQSAINRIEKGHQNLSLEMLARIGAADPWADLWFYSNPIWVRVH